MLRFLREKAHIIGLTIVISFGLTMFAGSVFLGKQNGESSASRGKDFSNEIAVLGDQPVPRDEISLNLNTIVSQVNFNQIGGRLTPEMLEIIRYNALLQTVHNMILREGANAANVKADKFDVDQAMDIIYRENDLKNKKAFKAILKKQDIDYKHYMKMVRADIKTRKFTLKLRDDVQVTDQDVEDKYTEVRGQHILFLINEPELKTEKEELAGTVYQKLQEGLSFNEAVKLYSDDKGNKNKDGDLGWFKQGTYVNELEKALFSLDKESYSKPFRSQYGFHIVKLSSKRKIDKPTSFDLTTEKQSLLKSRQETEVQDFISTKLIDLGLVVQDPFFRAYHSKKNGQILEAVSAYNQQVSRNPYSPE
ncbi:hypothetical protein DID80_06790, partial [Candidatus Marinamargulisbacteria bacterium SCGC AAA071-K20]